MTEGFLGLPLEDVTALLEESKIPYVVKGVQGTGRDFRVIRVKQSDDGTLEVFADHFKTTL